MSVLAVALLAQLAAPVLPVLAFPEPGLDDSAAYRGYRTRLFRDAAGNTVQVYLDGREGRVVHLLADAENASIAFSARSPGGRPAALQWGDSGASIAREARTRTLSYRLVASGPEVHLGLFLLGSMRVERDFQAWGRHRGPLDGPAFVLEEHRRLLAALATLPPATRAAHLALVGATSVDALRARLVPRVSSAAGAGGGGSHVVQPSLDGRDTLSVQVNPDPGTRARRARGTVVLRAALGRPVAFTVRITTTGVPLTPLGRDAIFTSAFLDYLAEVQRAAASGGAAALRARRMERQVRGVELLSSREKLMAGLPTYATYFGRDMLVSTLMMRRIWRDDMSAFVVASALRRLSPAGQVSHEEALGGQAVREAAAEYAGLVEAHLAAQRRGDGPAAQRLLARAATTLREHRRVRENYHMIDDELQLPVLAARWLTDPGVPAATRRDFLLDSADGRGHRLALLLRELDLVASMTDAYARSPVASNLISFAPRDSGRWAPASWRDSNAGYAGGRYAMDVNAIWAPEALASVAGILEVLPALGFSAEAIRAALPSGAASSSLGRYLRDPPALRAAIATWRGAWQHFLVGLSPGEVRARVDARLAALPAVERRHWQGVITASNAGRDSLSFLALALDATGQPIGVLNTDAATRLFLGGGEEAGSGAVPASALRDVRAFVRPYPVGLFIDRLGPVVANDAYASPSAWRTFERDPYHGPRVAWGREVNLFLLGVADLVVSAGGTAAAPDRGAAVRELADALERVVSAVEASGFHSELWSYAFDKGVPRPVRYGSGADVQLWSTTDLAVQYTLSRLRVPR